MGDLGVFVTVCRLQHPAEELGDGAGLLVKVLVVEDVGQLKRAQCCRREERTVKDVLQIPSAPHLPHPSQAPQVAEEPSPPSVPPKTPLRGRQRAAQGDTDRWHRGAWLAWCQGAPPAPPASVPQCPGSPMSAAPAPTTRPPAGDTLAVRDCGNAPGDPPGTIPAATGTWEHWKVSHAMLVKSWRLWKSSCFSASLCFVPSGGTCRGQEVTTQPLAMLQPPPPTPISGGALIRR